MLRLVADDDQRAALAAVVQAGEHAQRLDGKRAAEQRPGSSHRAARAATESRPPPTPPSPRTPSRTSRAVISPPGRAGGGPPRPPRSSGSPAVGLPRRGQRPFPGHRRGDADALRMACGKGMPSVLRLNPLASG